MLNVTLDLSGKIVFITGIMAAGKSTIAEMFARRLDRSVHLRGDVFRKMIVNGQEPMTSNPGEEAIRQLALRYQLGVDTALRYAAKEFAVIYQDIALGEYLPWIAGALRSEDYVFVLCPDVEAVRVREATRTKTGYRDFSPEQLDDGLRNNTERIGYWLDATRLSPEETLDVMIAHLDEARLST
ncbi:MAG: zeta toxin family protein [Pseudomonadales bacterium]|nr:zeta toxin family protein [Pseudomonadales bacterium]